MQHSFWGLLNLPPPFTPEWLSIWTFVCLGAFCTLFIKIEDIDRRLLYPAIAKPLIGIAAGMTLCLLINGDNNPPSTSLAFWGFVATICSSPIVMGFIVFISDQERQNALYRSAQERFLPFKIADKEAQGGSGDND